MRPIRCALGGGTERESWGEGVLSVVGYQLSVVGFQLSVVGFQLSVVGYQLSVVGYQLSVVGCWMTRQVFLLSGLEGLWYWLLVMISTFLLRIP